MPTGERLFESTINLTTGEISVRPHTGVGDASGKSIQQTQETPQVRIQPVIRPQTATAGVLGPKDTIYPAGAIESLKPVLAEAFDLYSLNQDQAYWVYLETESELAPTEACEELDRKGVSPLAAAKAVLNSDPQFKMAEAFGNTSREFKQFAQGRLAWQILSYYPQASQEKWAQELRRLQLPQGTT